MEIIQIHNAITPDACVKIASFDFDWTLAKPISDDIFSQHVSDIEWLHPSIPDTLKMYHNDGYYVMVVTNQRQKYKKQTILNLLSELNIPIIVVIGWKVKKPDPILFIVKDFDKEHSFFVGDAGGRPGDWSNADKMFADAVGITYTTPEDVFNLQDSVPTYPNFKPTDNGPEAVILVGYPGSGKTTFVRNVLIPLGFEHVNTDDYKSNYKKMAKIGKQNISYGKSVVFDATNPTEERRAFFRDASIEAGAKKVTVIHIETNMHDSMCNNNKREKPVPKIAYYVYRKKLEI